MVPSKIACAKPESLVCAQTPKHWNALSGGRREHTGAEAEEKTTESIEALYLPLA